tara:strand:- start:122 stop:1402 length:1281 start_codon:yes stop_codon:yes gene_type:complete
MKICVLGLWHLGSVTTACLSKLNYDVVGLDFDHKRIKNLRKNIPPVLEPKIINLIKEGQKKGNLRFIHTIDDLPKMLDYLWVAYDTPVNNNDHSDVDFVLRNIKKVIPKINIRTKIIISSQLPAGTIQQFKKKNKLSFDFIVIPENLRLGSSVTSFFTQDRLVIGRESKRLEIKLKKLLTPICSNLIFMKIESAEMTKHSINSFLAMSISFANEIASLCEIVGADYREVEKGIKSERRIGDKAYLSAGGPFAGGTLARDIEYLKLISNKRQGFRNNKLISSIKISNQLHKKWIMNKLSTLFFSLDSKNIAIWGLSYKENSDTLRRSLAVEIGNQLISKKANLSLFDPLIDKLPKGWNNNIKIYSSPTSTIRNADIIIVCTYSILYENITNKHFTNNKKKIVILDQNTHLRKIRNSKKIEYFTVGSN